MLPALLSGEGLTGQGFVTALFPCGYIGSYKDNGKEASGSGFIKMIAPFLGLYMAGAAKF